MAPLAAHERGEPIFRTVAEFLLCVLIMLLVVRTWLVEPRIVPSGSMAETLLGPHRVITCPHCGFVFRCDSRFGDPPASAVCPNCGGICSPGDANWVSEGDRLLVFKQRFRFKPPERFEAAVFQRPGQADQAYVKRVVGLPGESIMLRHGNLYVDGQLIRKTLDQQQALAVLVHDAGHVDPNLPTRWRSESAETAWRTNGLEFRLDAQSREAHSDADALDLPNDWLTYHHEQRDPQYPERIREDLIRDVHPYNQIRRGLEHRPAAYVADVRTKFHLQVAGEGELWFKAGDGREWFLVRIQLAGGSATLELVHRGWPQGHWELPAHVVEAFAGSDEQPVEVDISTVDRQFLIAVNRRELVPPRPFQWDEPPSDRDASSQPFAVAGRGLEVRVVRPRVFRDVYFSDPSGRWSGELGGLWDAKQGSRLGPDDYFMLGDNSAYSEDSRLWPEGPAVPGRLLIGRPIVVHLPSRWAEWSGRRFQVPDLERMRYIH